MRHELGAEIPTRREDEYDDSASVRSNASFTGFSVFSQSGHLLILVVNLKAWLFLLLPFVVALLISSLYTTRILTLSKYSTSGLSTYGAQDFAAESLQVLVDRGAFRSESEALERIEKKRNGNDAGNWLKSCSSVEKCRAKFISESDSAVVAYMRFSAYSNTRAITECFWVDGNSSHRCAYIYILMTQAIQETVDTNSVFQDVQLFTFRDNKNLKSDESKRQVEIGKSLKLKLSVCSDWIRRGTFKSSLSIIVSISLGLSTIAVAYYFIISTISSIRAIKKDGFLHHLVLSGLSVGSYWTAMWVVTLLECLLFASIFVLSYYLQCPDVFTATIILFVFLVFTMYCLNLAAIVLLLELLVPNILTIALLMTFLAVILMVAFSYYHQMVKVASFLPYLFPPTHTEHYITEYFSAHIMHKLTGKNPVADEGHHFLTILMSIVCSFVVLALLTIYLDFLLHSGNNQELPWYFPFSCRFWYPKNDVVHNNDFLLQMSTKGKEADPNVEPVTGLAPSIVALDLTKSYDRCCSKGPPVLRNLTCTIYQDQITALIGHNGAGKSTLIKILTGDELPNTGEAYVAGFKVTDSLERLSLRGNISVCMQTDSLCASMTVMQCIKTTAICKGTNIDSEIDRAQIMIARLGLAGKENVLTSELSGGQKRKVCTIMALLGDPEVVFLDEPTSGLDPVSRRQVWQLLQEKKIGRTIILCTHFMDEADILADRKIFLSGGEVVCAGSSLFLKKLFGCTLTLRVSLKSEQFTNQLLSKLKRVRVRHQYKTELLLEITTSNEPNVLIEAVEALEKSENILTSFSLCKPTLDDVFMRMCGVDTAVVADAVRDHKVSQFMDETSQGLQEQKKLELASQAQWNTAKLSPSLLMQLKALLCTNLKRQARICSRVWSRFILPLILICILGALVFLYMQAQKISTNDSMKETDTYVQLSKVRSLMYAAMADVKFGCIRDSSTGKNNNEMKELCAELALPSKKDPTDTPFALTKAPNDSLKEFLEKEGTLDELRKGCGTIGKSPCLIYYASSWSKREPNKNRTVAIGVFLSNDDTTVDTSHAFRIAFYQTALLFKAGVFKNSTSLSHLRRFSQYSYFNLDMYVFVIVFCLFPIPFVIDITEDVNSKVRQQLKSMGMSSLAYWLNTFLLHWLQYSICFIISVAMLMIWDRYRNFYFILLFCLPALFLGTTVNQLTVYVIASISKSASMVFVLCYKIFVCLLFIVLYILSTWGHAFVITLIFALPPMAPIALVYFTLLHSIYQRDYYHAETVDDVPEIKRTGINNLYYLLSLVAMPVHIILLICILVVIERWEYIAACCCCSAEQDDVDILEEVNEPIANERVANEAARILKSRRNVKNMLEIVEVSKTHPNGVRAVRNITFGAIAGEIIGIVGVNGAGKTTTLSMATGEVAPTHGSCEVRSRRGAWLQGSLGARVGAVGYCPQHNPLFDCITVAEHLRLYADIRGIPASLAERQAVSLAADLGLKQFRNHQARQLSGGNQRRLCLAIALLGDPTLVVIDEASTGVDPENKRFIWSAVRGMVKSQRSVLITSHSMEEVEALCNRVGVMNRGRMIAFGTVQQLRSLHGDAYALEVLMKPLPDKELRKQKADMKGVITSVLFAGATVLDDVGLGVQFYAPSESLTSLSEALHWLSSNYRGLGIAYYSLHQTSLDQVFVKLVKQYDGPSNRRTDQALRATTLA